MRSMTYPHRLSIDSNTVKLSCSLNSTSGIGEDYGRDTTALSIRSVREENPLDSSNCFGEVVLNVQREAN